MGSATTSAALGVNVFVLAATVGGFRRGLLVMIVVSAPERRAQRIDAVEHV